MNAARVVEPEWLDELPHEDPRAMRSRRDLVRVNALMGNVAVVAGELKRLASPVRSIAELGCGDGAFMHRVLDAAVLRDVEVFLVDRHPLVDVRALGANGRRPHAVTADVFEWLSATGAPPVDVIVANLFLHHFESKPLAELLALAARRTRAFIACEPRRSPVALAGARLLGLVGCNDVTRHDAVVSVRAGFCDGELGALWPKRDRWQCEERARGLFSHGFVARAS